MVSEGSGMLVMASKSFKQIITEDFPVSVIKKSFPVHFRSTQLITKCCTKINYVHKSLLVLITFRRVWNGLVKRLCLFDIICISRYEI